MKTVNIVAAALVGGHARIAPGLLAKQAEHRLLPRFIALIVTLIAAQTLSAPAALAQDAGHAEHAEHAEQAEQAEHGESRHVPPAPPAHPMPDMSNERMIELMAMDDTAAFGTVIFDQLEWRDADPDDALSWDAQAWYGDDYNKVWLKSEGERAGGDYEARTELLWDRIATRWWNVQAGIRHDLGEGPSRTWAAFGVQGLAPHWFEVEATLYVGEQGRTALRASAEYDLLLTQRLVLQPQFEFNAYGKADPAHGIGAGLADTELALRLRYEIRREFAPYFGIVWTRAWGDTADFAESAGLDRGDVQLVAGLRVWF